MYVYVCMYVKYVYMYVCISMYMYACKYVCIHIYIYMYMYICIYIYIYVYMYVCVYMHIFTYITALRRTCLTTSASSRPPPSTHTASEQIIHIIHCDHCYGGGYTRPRLMNELDSWICAGFTSPPQKKGEKHCDHCYTEVCICICIYIYIYIYIYIHIYVFV